MLIYIYRPPELAGKFGGGETNRVSAPGEFPVELEEQGKLRSMD